MKGFLNRLTGTAGERCFAKQFLCSIWQIVATHVGFVLFEKISQIRVTFATIFHNSDKSLITFVLYLE